jgi:hypothetical protein
MEMSLGDLVDAEVAVIGFRSRDAMRVNVEDHIQ